MKTLKVVSLFSGCGGGDLGMRGDFVYNGKKYRKLKFNCIFATDINAKALKTFSANFPNTEILEGDITKVDVNQIPECNIVVGGFPCQSFSTVNPTKDPFDARGNLYKEMVRVVKDKQPYAFIAENVKGLMTLHHGVIFNSIKKAFNDAGYNVFAKLLCAANYGVPQLRERVIMVGIRKDLCSQNFVFPKPTTPNRDVSLNTCIPVLKLDNPRYYFSEKAVNGMKHAKHNMKRGLAQDLSKPCLTITSHLAKVSINSRDPVLLVDSEHELYRRFTPREAARIQSFPDSFQFVGSEADSYRQIGNAIPPVMFWHVSRKLENYLTEALKENDKEKGGISNGTTKI